MRIIDLNTWNGKQKESITKFIQENLHDTDIFCFQEVYEDMRSIALPLLHDYNEIYQYQFGFEHETGIEDYAQAIYVRKSFPILKNEVLFKDSQESGLGIAVDININGKVLHLLNYHGVSRPKDKLDNEARLEQTNKLIDYYRKVDGPKILAGDFNFLPETESYNMFIRHGYKELVKSNNISTTRNRLYWDNRPQKHLFSDYIFTSQDIQVKNLTVPKIEVSDHLPLILEVE